jgi:MYXO-CTERM domain-containing protein
VDNGPPATERPVGEMLPASYGPAQFALAAGDDRVSRAIYEAWRGGMFSKLLDGVAPSIELSSDGIAQKLGLPGGTTVDLSINVARPPLARFGRNGVGSVRLELSDLGVTATITVPGAAPAVLDVKVDAYAAASVGLAPASGALQLGLDDLTIERLEVVGGEQQINVDPVRLHEFVRAVVTPMLAETLSGIEIAPALQAAEGFFTIARSVTTDKGWLRVAADMFRPDPTDETAPQTSMEDAPYLVSPAMTRFHVSGTDDTTPPELLRYRVRLDGTELGEGPEFMAVVKVSAEQGPHQLEVWAVDLNGNEDRTPVVHSFYVDGLPPELELVDAPAQVSGKRAGRVTWKASDDRTKDEDLATSWTLEKMVDGRAEVVASADFTPGLRHMDLPELDGNTLYVLRVIARDEAGNVTSVDHGFSVEPGNAGGCSASGGAGSASLILLGIAFLLVVRRRRRAAVGVLAAGLMAATVPASAQGVGTTLSGPTDGDGAASFWNPAAMFRGAGTQVEAGSAVSFIRASYQPMDTSTTSNTFVPKPEPTVGAVSDLGGLAEGKLRFGFTVAVPEIDGATWARDDGASDVTRWYTVQARSYHVTITPSLAYQPARWISFGAGVNVVRSRIEAELDKDMGKSFNQAADSPAVDSPFPYADPTFAAPVNLQATGWSLGAVAGVMVRPHRRVTFGASLHTETTSKARGDINVVYPEAVASFVNGSVPAAELPPLAGDMTVDLKKPLMGFAALAVEPVDRWEVRADYRFINRAAASDLYFDVDESTATSEDVKDSAVIRGRNDRHSFGLRVAHSFRRGLVAVRGRYEPNSIPDETIAPNNLDFDKLELGLAARLHVSRKVSLVAHYSHFFIASRTVESSLHQPYTEPTLEPFNHPTPTGTYGATSDYVALLLSVAM